MSDERDARRRQFEEVLAAAEQRPGENGRDVSDRILTVMVEHARQRKGAT